MLMGDCILFFSFSFSLFLFLLSVLLTYNRFLQCRIQISSLYQLSSHDAGKHRSYLSTNHRGSGEFFDLFAYHLRGAVLVSMRSRKSLSLPPKKEREKEKENHLLTIYLVIGDVQSGC